MTRELPGEERRRYRDLMNRSIGLGVTGLAAATLGAVFVAEGVADLLLIGGVGLYYLGVAGYLVVWRRTGVRLFDEREAEIERRAGHLISHLVTLVATVGVPADVVLAVTGVVDVPPAVRGAIWGYAVLAVAYALSYGFVEKRYS